MDPGLRGIDFLEKKIPVSSSLSKRSLQLNPFTGLNRDGVHGRPRFAGGEDRGMMMIRRSLWPENTCGFLQYKVMHRQDWWVCGWNHRKSSHSRVLNPQPAVCFTQNAISHEFSDKESGQIISISHRCRLRRIVCAYRRFRPRVVCIWRKKPLFLLFCCLKTYMSWLSLALPFWEGTPIRVTRGFFRNQNRTPQRTCIHFGQKTNEAIGWNRSFASHNNFFRLTRATIVGSWPSRNIFCQVMTSLPVLNSTQKEPTSPYDS